MLEGTKLMSSQRTARAAREDKMNMFALEQASLDNRAAIRASTSGSRFTAQDRLYNSTFNDVLKYQLDIGSTADQATKIARAAAVAAAPYSVQSALSSDQVTTGGDEVYTIKKNSKGEQIVDPVVVQKIKEALKTTDKASVIASLQNKENTYFGVDVKLYGLE